MKFMVAVLGSRSPAR